MYFKVHFSDDYQQQHIAEEIIHHWTQQSPSFQLHTSGSTGMPKPIQLERKLLEWHCENFAPLLRTSEYPLLCPLPINKTGGFMQLIRALYFHKNIFLATPKIHLSIPDDTLFSLTSFSPAQIKHLLENHSKKINQFQQILIGGAPLGTTLTQKLKSLEKVTIYETYGMTETASNIALKNISIGEEYFTAHQGVTIEYQEDGAHIEIPQIELSIKTTDILRPIANGFEFVGRVNDMINSDGIKINVLELEEKINPILQKYSPSLFYVTSQNHSSFGKIPVIILENPNHSDIDFTSFWTALNIEIDKKICPKSLYVVKRIHYTESQKIKRLTFEELQESGAIQSEIFNNQ